MTDARPPGDGDGSDVGGRPEPFAAIGGVPEGSEIDRVLFHATPVASFVIDLGTRDVVANDAFRRLFGLEPHGSITLSDLEEVTHRDDRGFTDDHHHRSMAAAEAADIEIDKRYIRRDGSQFWGHLTASPLVAPDGTRWGLIGAIAEVTDRVEAQAALAESEQRFKALVQNAADAIVVLDADARLVYASPSGERLTGNRTQDQMGADIFQFVHPDDRMVVAQAFLSIFEPGSTDDEPNIPMQFRVLHNSGSVRYVEAVATNLLADPAVNGVVVNIRDLTDTEEASSALELTERRFRRMIENISDTITLLDADASIVQVTGNVQPLIGYDPQSWRGHAAFDLVHPDDVDLARHAFAELSESPGQTMAGEVRLMIGDGEWIDAEIYAINLLDDPDVAAIVLTTRNISERKGVERELNEARDQAVRALQMRTEFVASVSHELRSPIHGVLGLSELLATSDLHDDARHLARSIGRATETLRMVLDDILDFTRIEVGRLEIVPAPLRLNEVGADLLALFGPEAQAKGISLVVEAEDGFPLWVMADGLRVRQVLTNLVGNAVKFTTSGEVRVSARRVTPRDGDRRTWLRVEVRDSGIGIPPEAHGRLFEPFSQAHTSTARDFGGTGLGLSIAKRLVDLMDGELGFESRPTEGSTFWIEVPVTEMHGHEIGPKPEVEADPVPVTGTRVMVVEDNPINQLLVRRQLERLGYEAVVFDAGTVALDAFPGIAAAVVLMDWQLPGIDGLETTRRLRALEHDLGRPRTPIVAMTASALPGDRERCLAAGMDDFIAKPVSMAMLSLVLRRWVAPTDEAQPRPLPDGWSAIKAATSAASHAPSAPTPPASTPPVVVRDGPPSWADAEEPGLLGAASVGYRDGVIDTETLDRLVEELSDAQLVASVVRTYLRELPIRIEAVSAALLRGDLATVDATTHVLRSTSAAVGAIGLADLCRRLAQDRRRADRRGAGRSDAAVVFAVDALATEAEAVHSELSQHLERLRAAPHPEPAG